MALKEIGITYGILELRQACTTLLDALDNKNDDGEKEKKKEEKEKEKKNEEKNAKEEKKEVGRNPLGWSKEVGMRSFPQSELARDMKAVFTRSQWSDLEIGRVPSFRALLKRSPSFVSHFLENNNNDNNNKNEKEDDEQLPPLLIDGILLETVRRFFEYLMTGTFDLEDNLAKGTKEKNANKEDVCSPPPHPPTTLRPPINSPSLSIY